MTDLANHPKTPKRREIDASVPTVQAWRALVEKYAAMAKIPGARVADRILEWIAIESEGNACSLDAYRKEALAQGHVPDVGPMQLYFDHPWSVIQGVTGKSYTSAQLRKGCDGVSQHGTCSPATREAQVDASIGWLARGIVAQDLRLAALGIAWSERDKWRWYKFSLHGLPAVATCMLPLTLTTLGRPPASWNEFRGACESMDPAVIDAAAHVPVANNCTACQKVRHLWAQAFDNAEEMDLPGERDLA